MKKRMLCLILLLAQMLSSLAFAEGDPIRIAVIDSGISPYAVSPSSLEEGRNYIFPEESTMDKVGHGTGVASIIVGSQSAGISGICPEAVLVPLVFLTEDKYGYKATGEPDELAAVIRDAIDVYHCDIINISLTTRETTDALAEAVAYAEEKGVLIVSSSGNNGSLLVYYPSGYDSVLCVGSLDETGTSYAKFTNRHKLLDILAPGVDVPVAGIYGEAATNTGTSFSSAYVTGVAAKLMTEYPHLTAAQVRRILCSSATDLRDPGFDYRTGWGALDTENAFAYAAVGRQYRDIPSDLWFFPGAQYVTSLGLMDSGDAVHFLPGTPMTRASLWVVLHAMDGGTASPEAETWYADAQIWASENGITDGRDPELNLTRAETAALLYSYAKYKGYDVSTEFDLSVFPDAGDLSAESAEALRWACGAGLMNGMDGLLAPHATATRAQIATMLMRLAEVM